MVTHEVRRKMPLLKAIELTFENLAEAAEFVGGKYDETLKRVVIADNLVARPGHYLVQTGVSGKWLVHSKDSLEKNFEIWSPSKKHGKSISEEAELSGIEVRDFPAQKDHPRVGHHGIGRRFVEAVEE